MRANEAGVRAALDTEFLHDYRVAVRRTRSALSQLKGVFDPSRLAPFRKEFAWLGEVTGPLRDLDVYLLTLPDYRSELPVASRHDLDPLEQLLMKTQPHRETLRQSPLYRIPPVPRAIRRPGHGPAPGPGYRPLRSGLVVR